MITLKASQQYPSSVFKKGYQSHNRSRTEANDCNIFKSQGSPQKDRIKINKSIFKQQFSARGIDNRYFNILCGQESRPIKNINKIRKISLDYQKLVTSYKSTVHIIPKNNKRPKYQMSCRTSFTSNIKRNSALLKQMKTQNNQSRTNQNEKFELLKIKSPQFDFQAWNLQVNKIYKCLQELKNVGAVDKKVNTWCYNYFINKKKGLIDIFMKKTNKKRSLNDEIVYVVINNKDKLIQKLLQTAVTMSQKQRYFLGIQICLYRNFLQQKIANKHRLELNQIQNRVKNHIKSYQMKQYAKQLYEYQTKCPQILGFFADLHNLQQNHGKLHLISIKNRRRFQNITNSQLNIQNIIYD